MENFQISIIHIVEDYLNTKISGNEFYNEIKKIYEKIILHEEDLFQMDNLLLSHFIVLIFSIIDDDIANTVELSNVLKILKGENNFSKTILIQVPKTLFRYDIEPLKKIIQNYNKNKKLLDHEFDYLNDIKEVDYSIGNIKIIDFIYNQLIRLFKILPYNKGGEFLCTSIYFDYDNIEKNKDLASIYTLKIIDLIKVFDGDKPFILSVDKIQENIIYSILTI